MPDNLIKIKNHYINYILKNKKRNGPNISVIFLSGYSSTINGTKANYINSLQSKYGFEYIAFDYSGHGKSTGNILDCYFEDWYFETLVIIKKLAKYPLIIVGSSMGGWIGILIAKKLKHRIKALIGIATAPDFTVEMIKNLSIKKKICYWLNNKIYFHSPYEQKPYYFSKKFINNSKKFLILKNKIDITSKLVLFYGLKDEVVNINSQIRILNLSSSKEASLYVSKNSDHRMSSKTDLECFENILVNFLFAQ